MVPIRLTLDKPTDEIDLSWCWSEVENGHATIAWFLKEAIWRLEKHDPEYYGRWIHHFKQLIQDRRFQKTPPSASALAKIDSVWDAFLEWCESRNITVHRKEKE